jgi:hypothetical protein
VWVSLGLYGRAGGWGVGGVLGVRGAGKRSLFFYQFEHSHRSQARFLASQTTREKTMPIALPALFRRFKATAKAMPPIPVTLVFQLKSWKIDVEEDATVRLVKEFIARQCQDVVPEDLTILCVCRLFYFVSGGVAEGQRHGTGCPAVGRRRAGAARGAGRTTIILRRDERASVNLPPTCSHLMPLFFAPTARPSNTQLPRAGTQGRGAPGQHRRA